MENKGGKKNNFILQAGILAAAGIISRIIGLLYRSPLTAVIKDEGMGYYSAAFSIYTIVLLISSYSIPSAISKVIAQKLAVREYRNAHRIFLCSTWYVLAVGGIASLFLFFGAGFLVDGPAVGVLRVFAPTIFLYGLLGVLRGYFQAHKSMVQTSVSQILEQIANAAVSVGAACLLINSFIGSMEIVENADSGFLTNRAMYGAMGSALGTGAGVLAALIFMWGIYGLNRRMILRRAARDHTSRVDTYGEISRTIVAVVTPFILSTAAYNLSTSLNSTLYLKLMQYFRGVERAAAYGDYGVFANKAVTISDIPVAFASAMAAAMIPSVAQLVARRNIPAAREKISMAVKTTMIIAIPSAVGLAVLARPITWLLFPQKDTVDLASGLLTVLAASVVFYSLSTLSSSILQGLGRVNVPIVNAVIALLFQTVVLVPLLMFTDCNLYALVGAKLVYSFMMCLLNQISVRKAIGYRQEYFRSFLVPLAAAACMGGISWGVYQGIYLLSESSVLAVIPAIAVGTAAYFVLLIMFRGITEAELRGMPKGHLLVKAAKKLRLLR